MYSVWMSYYGLVGLGLICFWQQVFKEKKMGFSICKSEVAVDSACLFFFYDLFLSR